MADGYDDEITPEEQAALDAHMKDGAVPPPDEAEGKGAVAAAIAEAATTGVAPAPAPAAPAPPAPPAPADAPAAEPVVDPELAGWLEKNKDKTPEELATLAFNADKRARKEGFKARTTVDQLRGVSERAAAALDARRAAAETEKAAFAARLAEDPDAVALEQNSQRIDADIAAAEADLHNAKLDEAIGFAETYIPDFQKNAPQVFGFGEEIGYSKEELGRITDGRDIVTLNLARLAGGLIKAGVIDVAGNFLSAPVPVAATDPRLNPPAPVATLGAAPARPGGAATGIEQKLTDIANLSDAEFDKLSSEELENLTRAAMAG